MSNRIELDSSKLTKIHEMDPRVQSYNIEMTELAGGTFWKVYTPGQVAGIDPFILDTDLQDLGEILGSLMELVSPINLYDQRIRTLAKGLGSAIIRYSGSWATRTYYDFDGATGGVAPEGFEYVMTKEQWQGALDFTRAVGGQILVSLANSSGVHKDGTGEWTPEEAKKLWEYTESQGMTIDYAEFMNEPNMLMGMMLPEGYGPKEYARDHDLFTKWIKENYPNTKIVGPSVIDSPRTKNIAGDHLSIVSAEELMGDMELMPEIYSYHSYSSISERGQFFGNHYTFDKATSEEYLGLTMTDLEYAKELRDKYTPGADIWVTESADAGCGGSTWASTFVETLRYIDEMARFNINAKGIIFHNTLASSAYGFLDSKTHEPRPQYWAALLYERLVGKVVYETHEPIREGVHLYAYSRKDGRSGVCYIYINNSRIESATIKVEECMQYTLTSDHLRSESIQLNGEVLEMIDEETLPELKGKSRNGEIVLPPASVSFLIV